MVLSTACLASNTMTLVIYVQLPHNTPQPCEFRTGLIRLPVKHYGSIVILWRQLCVIFDPFKVVMYWFVSACRRCFITFWATKYNTSTYPFIWQLLGLLIRNRR